MSKHLFPYRWNLTDGYPASGIEKNGLNVFGTFICGGGSTMGFKLAGFNHLGGVEIDKKLSEIYKTNHNPKFLYAQDIRDFVKRDDLPAELFNLDILEGSPPCSSFSTSGNREKDWGKEKKFAEGQTLQVLDDLFFEFIKLTDKLRPKVAIAENVKGLIQGNAKSYVRKIRDGFSKAGYDVQLFLLNAATMGVPQTRQRVFFICTRNDLNLQKVKLEFNEPMILYKEVAVYNYDCPLTELQQNIWDKRESSDRNREHISKRTGIGKGGFAYKILNENKICPTILASNGKAGNNYSHFNFEHNSMLSKESCFLASSFPLDYDIRDYYYTFLCGMSVPPIMMAQIANQLKIQLFP